MSPSSYASVYLNNPKAVDIVGIAVDDKDQSRGYHSVVIVKADSPYKNAGRFKRQSLRFADPDSTSGYLIPNHAFKENLAVTPTTNTTTPSPASPSPAAMSRTSSAC
ncbi:phosphonate ABC transporter substrate-binding protein [Klebsiella pneumoniae]|uniref:Phosphonate ABC transporter substrate-binding protein n=1 Tax=Klebsiella pneumoniae TaxID=573 RepID=A0A2X3BX97_KLEPN|nr:phosphonate ABC transporter substrate-binding protein [Klebsiella pneumoniae]